MGRGVLREDKEIVYGCAESGIRRGEEEGCSYC